MTSTFTLDQILVKVQGLIAKADHPTTPPAEADTCRQMAERMMQKYRIEESALGDAGKLQGYVPIWRDVPAGRLGEFSIYYRMMNSSIVQHLDLRGMHEHGEGGTWHLHVVGFESDVRFCELLVTSCALAFGAKLEPKYDPALSDQVNAYLMRSAGMEGKRIAMAIYGRDNKHLRPKVRKMFVDESLLRGEDPAALTGQGTNVAVFRKSYAEGFVNTVHDRLYVMRNARTGLGIVPVSRKEAIDEAFYVRYPQYRPQPQNIKRLGNDYLTCPKCAKAKSGYCNDHSYMRPRKARDTPFSRAGYNRGSAAASTIDLGGTREVKN